MISKSTQIITVTKEVTVTKELQVTAAKKPFI